MLPYDIVKEPPEQTPDVYTYPFGRVPNGEYWLYAGNHRMFHVRVIMDQHGEQHIDYLSGLRKPFAHSIKGLTRSDMLQPMEIK